MTRRIAWGAAALLLALPVSPAGAMHEPWATADDLAAQDSLARAAAFMRTQLGVK